MTLTEISRNVDVRGLMQCLRLPGAEGSLASLVLEAGPAFGIRVDGGIRNLTNQRNVRMRDIDMHGSCLSIIGKRSLVRDRMHRGVENRGQGGGDKYVDDQGGERGIAGHGVAPELEREDRGGEIQ